MNPQTPAAVEPAAVDLPSAPIMVAAERSIFDTLKYGASLPERFVRSAFGLTAGTARELAEFLVPRAFQDSKTYEVVIRNSLNFLISDIGGVTAAPTSSPQIQAENYLARKAVSNFMDFAGLATLHTSPLWMLAIVSDLAYGTKSYLQELARELQAQGLIDDASTIHQVDDLLNAVQQASGSAASTLDQPPLSVAELRKSVEQTRQALARANPRQLFPESEISRFWANMKEVAERENVSLVGVSGAIAMQAVSAMKSVSQGTLTGVLVAGQLMNRKVLTHYTDALSRINDQGLLLTVRATYEPYIDAIWKNFHSDRRTWTETLLDGRTYRRLWTRLRYWRRRPPPAAIDLPAAEP